MKIMALTGLRAADLPPLEAELGDGMVALIGTSEDASEARRALLCAVTMEEPGVRVSGRVSGAGAELLWGGSGGVTEAVEAAAAWIAGPALERVHAARTALDSLPPVGGPSDSGDKKHDKAMRRLEGASEELRADELAARELRAEWAVVTGDTEQATMEWLRERQDAETTLQAYRDHARELKARLGQLDTGGAEAPCPTCGRPLADHLSDVRIRLREEWESIVQDGSWWRRRREQLEDKPEQLRTLEERTLRLHAAMQEATERLEIARRRLREGEALHKSAQPEPHCPEGRALARLAAELRHRALATVLCEAGRLAERITASRVLWIRLGEEGPIGEGTSHAGAPAAHDRAAVDLACRVAAATLARGAGAPLAGMIVGEALEALDPQDRLRAVDVLGEAADVLGQVVIVTGTDLVHSRPEAFAVAYSLRGDARETEALQPLAVGAATLELIA